MRMGMEAAAGEYVWGTTEQPPHNKGNKELYFWSEEELGCEGPGGQLGSK